MASHSLPAPLAAFHSSATYRSQVQEILSRRESQRQTIAFSDPKKLAKIPLNVLSQEARNAFKANHADYELNAMRNRYSDIVPYDATRVVLGQRPAEQSYINASWIKEPVSSPRSWIASQAPTDETIQDFLSMFLHAPQDAASTSSPNLPPKVILMLTACRESGRQKSARYWPDSVGESVEFEQYIPSLVKQPISSYERPQVEWQQGSQHPIAVTFVSSRPSSEQDAKQQRGWRTNELLLTTNNAEVTIYQVEYLGWQDHGVPDSPHEVLQLLKHINSLLESTGQYGIPDTLVTHCSAGVGRTGSFIAIAWLAKLLEEINQANYSSLSTLEKSAQESPLGPLPSPSFASSTTRPTHRAGGLLPSFLHKDDKHQSNGTSATSGSSNKLDFVMATIDHLRDQRTTMVQTPKQVEFVYEVAKIWWEEHAR